MRAISADERALGALQLRTDRLIDGFDRLKALRRVAGMLLCSVVVSAGAAPPLPALGVDSQFSVSGLSSGGYMASQFAVAFSKDVIGLGVVAGGPYDCSQGNVQQATTRCSCVSPPWCSTPTPSVLAFQSHQRASGKAALKLVDPLENLAAQRVWLFSGGNDRTVPAANVKALELFYIDQMKVPRAQVRRLHLDRAGHGMPVPRTTRAVACALSAYPYLNHCQLDAARELLSWLYPNSVTRAPVDRGRLLEFDQTAHSAGPDYTGLGNTGYVYVPDVCTATGAACRLHVVFHGCRQARDAQDGVGGVVGSTFAEHAGYNRWAAGSRIVVLYPQVMPRDTGNPFVGYQYNPRGCWDFWGYTRLFPSTAVYATNAAPQMLAVRAMIAALQRTPP